MASGSASFKRILQLLEKWPKEEGKAGRDLGEFLRNTVNEAYRKDKFTRISDQKYWDKQYLSLQRIIQNEHKNKYPRILTSSATGLTAEECKLALSNNCLEELAKEDIPFYKRIFMKNDSKSD